MRVRYSGDTVHGEHQGHTGIRRVYPHLRHKPVKKPVGSLRTAQTADDLHLLFLQPPQMERLLLRRSLAEIAEYKVGAMFMKKIYVAVTQLALNDRNHETNSVHNRSPPNL